MENNHDIDKKFNEASKAEEPTTFPGFDKVWAKVEEKLDKKEDKKKIIPIWFPYGIAASLIMGLGAFYFINKKDVSEINRPVITQNRISPKVNSDIQVIDSTVRSNIEREITGAKSSNEKPSILAFDNKVPVPIKVPNVIYEMRSGDYTTDSYYIEKKDNNQSGYTEADEDGVLDKEDKPQDIGEVVITSALGIKKRNDLQTASLTTSNGGNDKKINRAGFSPQIAMGNYQNNVPSSNLRNEFKTDNNVILSLQGKVSGVTVTNTSNNYPTTQKIVIRGMRSLSGNNNALVVIDNVISSSEALKQLSPNVIKSIDVLKGSKATALYGSNGMNGVLLVTTQKKLSRKERKAHEKLQKVQDSIKKAKFIEKQNSEEYDSFVENPFELTKNQAVSTFSIDVDNAAYSNIRRMINNGEYVDKNTVRIEEMINYFKYSYPQPNNDQPFSINTEYSQSPWNSNHKLLKIGLQGKNIPINKLPASNLVFLIDVSGSMEAANKLPLLKSSFKVLVDQLRPQDKVGIVVYAGSAGMVLPMTSAKEKTKIISALDQLQAGGSTAGGEGIELAYKLAQENFIKDGNNRVIIATDGDFNVGASSTGDLQTLVEEKRKSGVFLTCLGFGMGNFKDNRIETLANKGNGNYAYIDTMQEANKFLGKEFAGSMYAIAKDVKIQIEFNPQYVKSYRLIGYENRKLKNEDFTNDAIDAGELGNGHTVTALYEIIPNNVKSDFLPKESELKYTNQTPNSNFGDELATVKFRYKKPDGDKSTEIIQVVQNSDTSVSTVSEDFQFASSVAWFGLILRNSKLISNTDLKKVEKLAKKGKGQDDEGYRAEFVRLVESYKTQQK